MRERFAEIVERHQRAVYAVAFAVTRDRVLADDVTQEAFLVAWRRLDELRDPERLAAWLCGIARNVARDACKRRRRETPGETDDIADRTTPFDALSDAQAEQVVANALRTVPPVYREPLVMFYVEQRSIEDVARALGLSTHTTNKRLSRGRARLAAQVDALVERRLTQRGPRPELVAGVLAAIAVLGASSHVDASPAVAKGSIMSRLVVPAVVVAAAASVGGATLLAAKPRSPSAATTSVAAPTTPRRPPAAPPAYVPHDDTSNASAPAPHAAPARPQLTSSGTPPDCLIAARHVAELSLDRLPLGKKFTPDQREQFISFKARAGSQQCEKEKWSVDHRICVMAAADGDDVFACREDAIGTPDEIAALPPELACDVLAGHVAGLAILPGSKFAVVASKLAERGKTLDMNAVSNKVADEMRTACETLPWSATVRRCVAASKTQLDISLCW